MARMSDQVPLSAVRPRMQAGVNTVGQYLHHNRVMLILTIAWSGIILVAVLAMLSLLNPAAVNPTPSPTPELQVERQPEPPPTAPSPTEFENPRALWSLFMAMAAAGCMAGAVLILLGLRRALLQNAVFQTTPAGASPAAKPAANVKTTAPARSPGKAKATAKVKPPGKGKSPAKVAWFQGGKAVPSTPTIANPAGASPRSVSPPLHLVPPPVASGLPSPPPVGPPSAPAVQAIPRRSPKPAKVTQAKVRPKAGATPQQAKPSGQPVVAAAPRVGSQGVPSPGAVPTPPPPSVPKVASLQKAAQKKAAQKKAAQPAAAPAEKKGRKSAKAARQGTPTPVLSSLQAGVTIVPAEQSHPLDWHEHGIAEAMDMRKRRPLSSLMMRRR